MIKKQIFDGVVSVNNNGRTLVVHRYWAIEQAEIDISRQLQALIGDII